ncbi:MAG: FAD:protein FMN transferase [Actinomycetales bacterium]
MDAAHWTVWGLQASVVVTEPASLPAARVLVRRTLAAVDEACSRFRSDSELSRLQPLPPGGATVTPMLALLVEKALEAAEITDGDVDPTLGRDLDALGYDRDILSIAIPAEFGIAGGTGAPLPSPARPGRGTGAAASWRRMSVRDRVLKVPAEVRLDLGATAKAVAADLAAAEVFAELDCGVLVSLGGDLASAGPAPAGGWQIDVQDLPADPAQQISLAAGQALATSSTQKRRWQHRGTWVHHILDPRFGTPADPAWRSVTVAAPTCLEANARSTAAVVRGFAAVEWFRTGQVAARLVDRQGRVVRTGGWPAQEYTTAAVGSRG